MKPFGAVALLALLVLVLCAATARRGCTAFDDRPSCEQQRIAVTVSTPTWCAQCDASDIAKGSTCTEGKWYLYFQE